MHAHAGDVEHGGEEPAEGKHVPLPRNLSKSYSNPPIFNYFDKKDPNSSVHIAHDHSTAFTLAHITAPDMKKNSSSIEVLDDEVCKVARRLRLLAAEQRKLSKRSAAHESEKGVDGSSGVRAWFAPIVFLVGSIAILAGVTYWTHEGHLHHDLGAGHVHLLRTRLGFVKSPLYTASPDPGNTIELHGYKVDVFDLRIVVMATTAQQLSENSTESGGGHDSSHGHEAWTPAGGFLRYELVADGEVVHTNQVVLRDSMETEFFETVQVSEKLGHSNAKHFSVNVWADTTDGQPVAFLMQVLQMGSVANWRFWLGTIIFGVTFAFIISEVIHRVYSAFIGTCVMHFVIAQIQETPELHELTTMIDYGTLMLLFSMMIMMHMLSLTGFFEWFTIQLVSLSNRSPQMLFFLLSNAAGILSAFLDNVTVTLLTGPLAFSLAEKTGVKSMPLYLAITIAASVGGTATMIGDPPNIVIGSKMEVGFERFLMFNGPLTVIILPLSTLILFWQFKDTLVDESKLDHERRFNVDIKKLKDENTIHDMPTFQGLMAILCGVLLALILSPLHRIEPAWFTVIGMFAAATIYHKHHIEDLLLAVEWDTLLFFAVLFVLVESLQELGVIRQFGDYLVAAMQAVPEDGRMLFALSLFLWVSAIGSAFLESLPYTSTIISLLLDLRFRRDELPGMDVDALVWSLSVGACVGGIGSIMGSSTNLTAVAISERYGKKPEDKVMGWHFLRYGFPLMLILTLIAMFYHWIVFVALGIKG